MNWIKHPLVLEGRKIVLTPMREEHFDGLIKAGRSNEIWTWFYFDGSDKDAMRSHLNEAIQLRATGEQYPFTIIDKKTDTIIGSTRFLQINEEHRNLEVGVTWYQPEYWGKGYNEECKLLQLTYCFEILKTVRVLIAAWDKNVRSRKAIERIGAKFEGTLRNLLIRKGEVRNVAYYSIIPEEWPTVKQILEQLLAAHFFESDNI